MDNLYKNEQEIEDILNSIDGIVRADAPPFFYTRLQARMQKQDEPSFVTRILGMFVQPIFAVATLSLFAVLNLATLNTLLKQKKEIPQSQVASDASLQSFAKDYDLSVSTLYGDAKNN